MTKGNIQTCMNCNGMMDTNPYHNCIRGITDNINNLRKELYEYTKNRKDHLDGLNYALKIIEQVEYHHQALGNEYSIRNPFDDIKNKIKMYLGLPLND